MNKETMNKRVEDSILNVKESILAMSEHIKALRPEEALLATKDLMSMTSQAFLMCFDSNDFSQIMLSKVFINLIEDISKQIDGDFMSVITKEYIKTKHPEIFSKINEILSQDDDDDDDEEEGENIVC